MGLPGPRPRPARGEALPALARRPRYPRLRASGGGLAPGLQLCRRGREPGLGARRVNSCGLGNCVRGCAWVWTCVGCSAARPSVTPPLSAAACAAPTRRRVCAATQLARGPGPPGRGPGRKTLPIREAGGGGGGSGTRLLLLRLSETWCLQGPACVTDLRPRRRGEELAKCRNLVREASSPSPSSVHGKVDMGTARAGSLGTEVQGWQETGRALI